MARDKGCDGLWAGATLGSSQGPEKGLWACATSKSSSCAVTPRELLSKKGSNPHVDFLVFMTSWWLKGWAVPEVLAPP